jgi:hypothetical protein
MATHYLCIDIEATGSNLNNTINAIGIFFAPRDYTLLKEQPAVKKRWALLPREGEKDDPATMSEFWDKFKEVKEKLDGEARDPKVVMRELLEFFQKAARDVGPRKIKLVTDCPDFDVGRLDYLGYVLGVWAEPIRYFGVNVRHGCVDPSERLDQVDADDDFKAWVAKVAPHARHSHYPDDDAEYNYWQMVYFDKLKEEHKQRQAREKRFQDNND